MNSEENALQLPGNGRKPPGANGKSSGVVKDYIAVARGSDLVVFRVVGQGTMLTAPALAEFAEQQRQAGFRRFVFDLERCKGLDSTFMGTMVGLHLSLKGEAGRASEPAIPPLPAAPPPGQPAAVPEAKPDAPMSPEEAVAALKALFATPAAAAAELDKTARDPGSTEPPKPPQGLVSAVNVPPEIGTLMAMLGVDRFVKIRGTYDLGQLETTILSEKNLTRDEQFRIILKTHSALIEIDQRNQARFGPLLQGLSQALEDEK